MKTRERLIWGIATTVLVALNLYLGQQWRTAGTVAKAHEQSKTELISSQAEAASQSAALRSEIATLKGEIERLRQQLQQAEARPIIAISDVYISDLQSQGLKDPVSDVLADLQRRTDLLPFEATLGGQMRFSPWLINRHWVIAGVGDGHRGGWAVLKYKVKDGQITWTLLEAAES